MTGLLAWGEMICNLHVGSSEGAYKSHETHLSRYPRYLAQFCARFFALRNADV